MSNMNNSFRKIRPSFGDSSTPTSTPNTSESTTGSDPRHVRGEKEVEGSTTASSKRRRVPESVTRNACVPCKKARAKVNLLHPWRKAAFFVYRPPTGLTTNLSPLANISRSAMATSPARDATRVQRERTAFTRSISSMQRRNW